MTSIFAKVRFLVKQLRVVVGPNKNIWDNMAIVVATQSLYNDFKHVILDLLG